MNARPFIPPRRDPERPPHVPTPRPPPRSIGGSTPARCGSSSSLPNSSNRQSPCGTITCFKEAHFGRARHLFALVEMNRDERDIGRRDSADTQRLPQGSWCELRKLLFRLVAQADNRSV